MPYTEFTIRSGGNNLYAGTLDGIAEASTTPFLTYTNGGWDGSSVYTPAGSNPVSDGVQIGHWVSVRVDGSTTLPTLLARVSAVSSTTITLSFTQRNSGTVASGASGRTLVVGGAWAGPGAAVAFPFNASMTAMVNATGDYIRINFKNDQTYTVTAAMSAN
jgi:hypothetical protein